MAVNKVEVNGETKLDLTQDTVTPENLLSGATAHNAAGEPISGAVAVAEASTTTPKAPGKAAVGTETKYARGDHVHPLQKEYEAKLLWGGANIFGGVSPIDAAIMPELCTNRAAFAKPKGVVIEYSTDSGETWEDYGASDDEKVGLLTMGGKFFRLGNAENSESSANMLRITVNALDCNFYTALKKIIIHFETRGNPCLVKIEKAYGSAINDFLLVGDYAVDGNEGENSYEWNEGVFGAYSKSQANNIFLIRFTFRISSFKANTMPGVSRIMFIGETTWKSPSNMAKTGHLYMYDANQNATFPAHVKAVGFSGEAGEMVAKLLPSASRENIASGENLSTLFGKIAKWFADLKVLAFKDTVSTSDLDSDVQAMLAAGEVKMRKVTLTVAGWNSSTKQQAAAVSGVFADGTKQRVICSPVDESYDSAWNTCYVQCVGHEADSLTFQCDEIPTAAMEVFVSIQSVNFAS